MCSNITSKEDTSRINYIESTGIKCLTPRQACGVESGARQNPYMSVKVYFNTVEMNPPSWDDRIMRPGRVRSCTLNHVLTSHYSNVEMIAANFTDVGERGASWPGGRLPLCLLKIQFLS